MFFGPGACIGVDGASSLGVALHGETCVHYWWQCPLYCLWDHTFPWREHTRDVLLQLHTLKRKRIPTACTPGVSFILRQKGHWLYQLENETSALNAVPGRVVSMSMFTLVCKPCACSCVSFLLVAEVIQEKVVKVRKEEFLYNTYQLMGVVCFQSRELDLVPVSLPKAIKMEAMESCSTPLWGIKKNIERNMALKWKVVSDFCLLEMHLFLPGRPNVNGHKETFT